MIAAAMAMCVSTVFGQGHDLVIQSGATFSGSGTITVKDSIINTGVASAMAIHGKVILNNTTNQAIGSTSAGAIQIDSLSLWGSGTKTALVTVTVADSLNVVSGAVFNMSGDTLIIQQLSGNAGTITTNASSVIEYIRSDGVTQSVMSGAFSGKIRLLNNSRKVLGSVMSVDSLEHSGWGLTINANLTVNAKATIDSLLTVSSGTIFSLGSGSGPISHLIANAGTINQSGTGSITFTNAAMSNGTITNTSNGIVTFANNLTGTGTVSQTAGGTMNVGGLFTQNTYTFTGTNDTVIYNSSTAQNVIGASYYNLKISSATDTTLANYKTATGLLTLSGNLIINSGNTLDMQGYSTSVFGAGSSNSGKIKWSAGNVYVAGGGTTDFYSPTAGNVATGTNYGSMLFSGTGMKTFAINPATATSSMTANLNSQITINNGVTLQVNGNLNTYGTITNNGAFNIGN